MKAHPDGECLWSRERCYTWAESYNRVNQYGHWYLSQGVKPGDLVALYLQNSPDFLFAWLGLWSIGAAPAMINHNLAGKALIHCIRVPNSKLILVDEDVELRGRIEAEKETLEGELGIKIVVMDSSTMSEIRSLKAERPEDIYREGVKGNSPVGLLYTRSVFCAAYDILVANQAQVEQQGYLKDASLKYPEAI